MQFRDLDYEQLGLAMDELITFIEGGSPEDEKEEVLTTIKELRKVFAVMKVQEDYLKEKEEASE